MIDTPAEVIDLKQRLLSAMQVAGVETVRVEYSGSGDSGCIDAIELQPTLVSALQKDVRDLAESLTEQLIDHYHAGYENNDGGQGVVTVEAAAGTIEYERTDYYTESTTELGWL